MYAIVSRSICIYDELRGGDTKRECMDKLEFGQVLFQLDIYDYRVCTI